MANRSSTATQRDRRKVLLIASGDLRLAANQQTWAEQKKMEEALRKAVAGCGHQLVRAHS